MKKTKYTLALILSTFSSLFAQVPDPGFELINPDSVTYYWNDFSAFAISDSVVIDEFLYHVVEDPHSGNLAMELRNAYDFTNSNPIMASISAVSDTVIGWSLGLHIPVSYPPTEFSFFYKYSSVSGDTGYAVLRVQDSSFNEIGIAEVFITGQTNAYTQIVTPINYSGNLADATTFSLKFMNAAPYTQANYGTRFTIDDVIVSSTTSVNENNVTDVDAWYNPSTDEILIRHSGNQLSAYVYNLSGQVTTSTLGSSGVLAIPVSRYKTGLYMIRIESDGKVLSKMVPVMR